jgi:hypothetical protein
LVGSKSQSVIGTLPELFFTRVQPSIEITMFVQELIRLESCHLRKVTLIEALVTRRVAKSRRGR